MQGLFRNFLEQSFFCYTVLPVVRQIKYLLSGLSLMKDSIYDDEKKGMKSILRLLLGVMLASVTWTGQMNAGECSVDVKNLHMEAVLLPGTAGVYTVHASCRMQCRHHSGVYGLKVRQMMEEYK